MNRTPYPKREKKKIDTILVLSKSDPIKMSAVDQVPAVAIPESQLPMRKRKQTDDDAAAVEDATGAAPAAKAAKKDDPAKAAKRPGMSKAREIRLEQNRKAARESRRRKKVLIDELQRSVIFFSRANHTLKQQNDDLTRLFMQAQTQVSLIENGGAAVSPIAATATEVKPAASAAQSTSAEAAAMSGTLPPMHPGATMQAMANFQQAAAVAMQAAVQGMKGIPSVSVHTLAAPDSGACTANSQQAYNDTMTAMAMQQAAVVAAAAASSSANPPLASTTPATAPADTKNEVSV